MVVADITVILRSVFFRGSSAHAPIWRERVRLEVRLRRESKMKTKTALGRLGPLHIPKRELSYSLNMNLQGLATFSYKGTDAVSGQFEHILAEKGEHGFSFNVIEVGPELGHGQAGSVRLARHVVSGTSYALKEVNISEEGTRHQVYITLCLHNMTTIIWE